MQAPSRLWFTASRLTFDGVVWWSNPASSYSSSYSLLTNLHNTIKVRNRLAIPWLSRSVTIPVRVINSSHSSIELKKSTKIGEIHPVDFVQEIAASVLDEIDAVTQTRDVCRVHKKECSSNETLCAVMKTSVLRKVFTMGVMEMQKWNITLIQSYQTIWKNCTDSLVRIYQIVNINFYLLNWLKYTRKRLPNMKQIWGIIPR